MVSPYEVAITLAGKLCRLTAGAFAKKAMFVNSGAEAVENAVKIARAYTKRPAVIVFDNAYHGRTLLTMTMTSKVKPYKLGFGPFAPEVYRMPASYPLRDSLSGPDAAARTISRIEKEIGAESVAAIVLEPIQGEGGFIVPAPGFVAELARFAHDSGALLVADEIQSGFCRTGDWFASEHEGVVPDLITTAKGIAGGMPLSAVTGRADVMDAVHAGGLGGTYTGNPVACAAALAAIEWMEDVDACGLARTIDAVITARLTTLKDRHPEVVQIRGRGAMKAIEIASPRDHTPDAARTAELNAFCHRNGVVTLVTGTYGNVMRFLPPLSIPSPALEEAFDVLDEAFAVTFD
jgi:4-aminobutyrate aminotransferase/(S)-3-amino-2-methylpropionate transaminase